MEFFIRKGATLPLLKLNIVQNGRNDYDNFMNTIELSSLFFSMTNVDSEIPKIVNKPAGVGIYNSPIISGVPQYYVYYQFQNTDTSKEGRFEGEFILKNDDGVLVLPLGEKLFINVSDSFIIDDIGYSSCYVIDYACCNNGSPLVITSPTPTPTQTVTPTPTITTSITPSVTVTPTITNSVTPTATTTPTPTITPSITLSLTPTQTSTTTPTVTPSITSSLTPTPTPTSTTNYPTISFKGLYVNDFNTIIGDANEENNLSNFIQQQGFNSIYCYDLSGVLSTISGRTAVRSFNTNIRNYGVTTIGGIGGSSTTLIGAGDNSRLSYNNGCTQNSEKYDYFNLENEFWNYPNVGTVTFENWKTYVNDVNSSLSSTSILFDSYIGQIDDPTSANTQTQISDFLVGNLDRTFLACYVTTNQFTGSTNYGFNRIVDELTLIGDSAISASTVAKVAIIYHGGSSFMNSYFQEYGFDSAYNNFTNVYNSWSGTSKNGIELIGYIIYGYQQVKI